MQKEKSFTIIELLVVIAIIGLLSSIILISTQAARERGRIGKALAFSGNIHRSMGAYATVIYDFNDGTASDSSGNSNNGTVFGAAPFAGMTELGSALSFDGSTNNYVIKNPINNFPTQNITVEFWMKSSDKSKNGTILSYATTHSDNEILIYDYNNLGIYVGGPNVLTGVSANDGNWHHIAVAWKSSGGNLSLYKDGEKKYSGTLQANYTIFDGGSLVLGQEQDTIGGGFAVSQAFLGLLDDVRIYSQELSLSKIQKDYAEGLKRFSAMRE